MSPASVSKVVIYNRYNCCKERLSNSVVSLLNSNGKVVGSYDIGNAPTKIEIPMNDFVLPLPMHSKDIGAVGIPGKVSHFDDGSWAVTASGADIWG